MDIKEVVGIDVGKKLNEARIHTNQKIFEFENNISGFRVFEKWVMKNVECQKNEILFAFEHTGLYSYPISVYFSEKEYLYVVYLLCQIYSIYFLMLMKHFKKMHTIITHYSLPRWLSSQTIMPFCACRRFSASEKITSAYFSKVSSLTSYLR